MRNLMDLRPTRGEKSFYGKAKVELLEDGGEVLYSYGTRICCRTCNGDIIRYWGGWSMTTGRHIMAFCGMNKAQFTSLKLAY